MRGIGRATYAARVALGALALSLASAGAAYASIADGAVVDNGNPVLVVTCHLVEGAPGEPPTEVCVEAQMGGGVGSGLPTPEPSPEAPDPTAEPSPDPTAEPAPEPTLDPDPSEPPRTTPATPATSGPSRQPPTASGPASSPVPLLVEAADPDPAVDAGSGAVPAADTSGTAATIRRLPATGPSDVDLPLLALALGLAAGGATLMRRARA